MPAELERLASVCGRKVSRRGVVAGAMAFCDTALARLSTPKPAIGIQLFMFLDAARRDLAATFQTIASIGYREVELLAGIGSVEEIRRALVRSGLRARSMHVPPTPFIPGSPTLSGDLDRVIADARALGLEFITCSAPYVSPDKLKNVPLSGMEEVMAQLTTSDWVAHRDLLNAIARPIRRAGLRLAYHNHAAEFAGPAGKRGMDILLAETSSADVSFELDCGWALAAGVDPVEMLRRHGNRIAMLHLKDVAASPGSDAGRIALGQGVGVWRAILTAADNAGVRAAFVEREQPIHDAADAARIDLEYLQKLGIS